MIIDAQFAPSPDANIESSVFTLTSSDIPDSELVEPSSNVETTPMSIMVKPNEEVRIVGQKVDFPLIKHEGLGDVPLVFTMTLDQLYKILSDAGSPSVIFKSIKFGDEESSLIDFIMREVGTEEIYIPSVDGFNALALVNNSYLTVLPLTVDQIYIDLVIASMLSGTEEALMTAENMVVISGSISIAESLKPNEVDKAISLRYTVEGAGSISQVGSAPVVNLPDYVPMTKVRTKIVAMSTVATIGASLALRTIIKKK